MIQEFKDERQYSTTSYIYNANRGIQTGKERATNALRANAVYSIFGLISFPILRNAEMPGSCYIVHRPGRERELSTDIFPVRER